MISDIFFPVAGITFNPFILLGLGVMGGFASGMLGISGGVIITPGLIFFGVPPLVAVASQLTNSIGTNLIGFIGYWRQRDVDFGLAAYLFIGGIFGAVAEIYLLDFIHSKQGQGYAKMTIAYVTVLTILGTVMLFQNIKHILTTEDKKHKKAITMRHWMIYVPFHRIFKRSRTEMSVLIPLIVGFLTGLLTSTLGGGNNLFMMPIVSYLIGRATPVVSGTTLLAAFAITLAVSIVHGLHQDPFDMYMVLFLLVGSTLGSQMGVRFGYILPRPYLGLLAGVVVLLISSKFIFDLIKMGLKASTPNVNTVRESLLLPHAEGTFSSFYTYFAYTFTLMHAVFGILCVIIIACAIEQLVSRFISPSKSRR
jgi:uncharacterized membrane protein YfcA